MASSHPSCLFHCNFAPAAKPTSQINFSSCSPPSILGGGCCSVSPCSSLSDVKTRSKFEKFQGESSQDSLEGFTPSSSGPQQQLEPTIQVKEDDDSCLPPDLEGAVRQSGEASASFLLSGGMRAIVELVIPKLQSLDDEGSQLELWELSRIYLDTLIQETDCQSVKAIFPDSGTAALLKYRWKDASFGFASLGDRRPVLEEDEIVVMIMPDYQMLQYVEQIASNLSDDSPRPLVMWNPRLISQDVGIGFNGRRLRRYFLSTFTTVYFMRPLQSGAVFRCYPGLWKVFYDDKERFGRYLLAKEQINRPDSEDFEMIFREVGDGAEESSLFSRAVGIFSSLSRFMKAIST